MLLSCFPYFTFICISFKSIITFILIEFIFSLSLDFYLIYIYAFILFYLAFNFYFIVNSSYFILL